MLHYYSDLIICLIIEEEACFSPKDAVRFSGIQVLPSCWELLQASAAFVNLAHEFLLSGSWKPAQEPGGLCPRPMSTATETDRWQQLKTAPMHRTHVKHK